MVRQTVFTVIIFSRNSYPALESIVKHHSSLEELQVRQLWLPSERHLLLLGLQQFGVRTSGVEGHSLTSKQNLSVNFPKIRERYLPSKSEAAIRKQYALLKYRVGVLTTTSSSKALPLVRGSQRAAGAALPLSRTDMHRVEDEQEELEATGEVPQVQCLFTFTWSFLVCYFIFKNIMCLVLCRVRSKILTPLDRSDHPL